MGEETAGTPVVEAPQPGGTDTRGAPRSGRALALWLGVAFLGAVSVFSLGVLVGRSLSTVGRMPPPAQSPPVRVKLEPMLTEPEKPPEKAPASKGQIDAGLYQALQEQKGTGEAKGSPGGVGLLPEAGKPGEVVTKAEPAKGEPAKKAEPEKRVETSRSKAPAEARAPAQSAGRYTVQVASFSDRAPAQQMVERLRKNGYTAEIRTVNLDKRGIWHRVRVGAYATEEEARRVAQALQKEERLPSAPLVVSGEP